MEYTIRPMESGDYEDVRALWERTEHIGLNESDERRAIELFLRRNPGCSLVALNGEALSGAVLVGHDGRRGYLHHLAVEVGLRGRGLGSALVDRSLVLLREAGIHKCNVFVFADNHAGVEFWRRQGFALKEGVGWMQRLLTS